MTSRDRPSSSYSRRFLWLAAAIVLAIVVYTLGWRYAAAYVVREAEAAVAAVNQDGRRANCENAEARGYPFRIGVFCRSVLYVDARSGVSFRAGAFRSAAQVYNPSHVIGELDGPALVEAPGVNALDISWNTLRASVRLDDPLPERLSVEARGIVASRDGVDAPDDHLFAAEAAELHMRPNGDDLDVAWRFTGLAANEALVGGSDLPLIDGEADVTIVGGARSPYPATLRDVQAIVRDLTLRAGGTAAASLRGEAAVAADGLVDADLQVVVHDPQAWAAMLTELFPQARSQIQAGVTGLMALGSQPTLPLSIRRGEARIGFVPLGRIPPL